MGGRSSGRVCQGVSAIAGVAGMLWGRAVACTVKGSVVAEKHKEQWPDVG